jgi:hypothetical protein
MPNSVGSQQLGSRQSVETGLADRPKNNFFPCDESRGDLLASVLKSGGTKMAKPFLSHHYILNKAT